MKGMLLAAAAALALGACSNLGCDASGSDRSSAGMCGLHTTFLANAAHANHARPLAKA